MFFPWTAHLLNLRWVSLVYAFYWCSCMHRCIYQLMMILLTWCILPHGFTFCYIVIVQEWLGYHTYNDGWVVNMRATCWGTLWWQSPANGRKMLSDNYSLSVVYGIECWTTKRGHVDKIGVAKLRILRWMSCKILRNWFPWKLHFSHYIMKKWGNLKMTWMG